MLFTRFLAENGLLIEPENNAAISLDLCRELAAEKGEDWIALASSYAVGMLPQIFSADDPVLEVTLPPETRLELEEILEKLAVETFSADDSLGWVYQFWQAEQKKAINDSEVKIGSDEIAAVTQLFTEDYMVLFLLDNTIGAWWAGKVLRVRPELAESAAGEQELRDACKVGDVEWTYLRFIREQNGPWQPAAGTFDGWPKAARDITVLDPCMGSGHFLVFALPILASIRAEEESLSRADAFIAVIRDNLYGLEIDARCTQIAAFNLALATWRTIGYRPDLPRPHLACSGLSIAASEKDWVALAGADSRARETMSQLYALFKQAPVLGSLIDPKRIGGDLFTAAFEKVSPTLEMALAAEHENDEENELAISARGLIEATRLLISVFTLVATNVPYLVRGKQSSQLQEFCSRSCSAGDQDLATVFLSRCATFCAPRGTSAVVSPQNWLFIKSYTDFRRQVLRARVEHVAKIGSGALAKASWDVLRALTVITNERPAGNDLITGLEAPSSDEEARAAELRSRSVQMIHLDAVLAGPDSRLSIRPAAEGRLLSTRVHAFQGLATGDYRRFGRYFWEVAQLGQEWALQQTTSDATTEFSGFTRIVFWEDGSGDLTRSSQARVQGLAALGRKGVAITQMRWLNATLFMGTLFDNNIAAIIPEQEEDLGALWAFCSSREFGAAVRRIDEKLGVTNATLVKIPFNPQYWQEVFAKRYPSGLPTPKSDDPAQWLFSGSPARSSCAMNVAAARLVGYRWPRQTGTSCLGCSAVPADGLESYVVSEGLVPFRARMAAKSAGDLLTAILLAANAALQPVQSSVVPSGIDHWLQNDFFEEHCNLFQHTPFVWHIWDGRSDGFHVLANYHNLAAPNGEARRTLEKLIYTYLSDWVEQQRLDAQNNVAGAGERLAAAEHLRRELIKIIEGEAPYDIFVRWKPLHEQSIGWEPDINDGVRINIRPFMAARTLNGKSIFRVAPKITWNKDRGKEPVRPKEDYPWFWGWDEEAAPQDFAGGSTFDGNRWNDLHYTRPAKEKARQQHKAKQHGEARS
jgi:hypothetical protein